MKLKERKIRGKSIRYLSFVYFKNARWSSICPAAPVRSQNCYNVITLISLCILFSDANMAPPWVKNGCFISFGSRWIASLTTKNHSQRPIEPPVGSQKTLSPSHSPYVSGSSLETPNHRNNSRILVFEMDGTTKLWTCVTTCVSHEAGTAPTLIKSW